MVVVKLLCSDFRSPGAGIFGFLSHFRLEASSYIYLNFGLNLGMVFLMGEGDTHDINLTRVIVVPFREVGVKFVDWYDIDCFNV